LAISGITIKQFSHQTIINFKPSLSLSVKIQIFETRTCKPMTVKLKTCAVLVLLLTSTPSFSQTTKDSTVTYTKEYIDSLSKTEDFQKEFNAFVDSLTGSKSYFDISTGIGNRLFSLRNNAFNTQQVSTNKLTLTPTLSYVNKTGIALSWTSFLVFDGDNTGFAQHAITPSYDFVKNGDVGFGLSYTRYFINSSNSFSSTPFQNEVYAYVNAKKGWLQPGLSVGWAKGKYTEEYSYDTTFKVTINGIERLVTRTIRDTIKTSIRDFSLIGTLKHDFEWYEIFGNNDDISLTPTLMLVAGAQKYNVVQSTSVNTRLRPRVFKTIASNSENGSTGFRFQSVGINLSSTYTTGKFYISPQYYLDYYLPNDLPEGEKRTTGVFTVTVGITF
jgi:hypothetical protein